MIFSELRKKQIPATVIKSALNEINEEEYRNTLSALIEKKYKVLGGRSPENEQKAARFAASKGYEPELIFRIIGKTEEN